MFGQVIVATQHNDNARTGQNVQETLLTPANVNANRFAKLFAYGVDGFIVGQPLYMPNVKFATGVYNAVYVATQHDSVYAFDAQGKASQPLWHVSFINPSANVVTETISQQGCAGTGYTEIGIMGTPVIDTSTSTLYVVAKSVESGVYIFRLHALDLATGSEKFGGPVPITGSVINSSGAVVMFKTTQTAQRPGLLLTNGMVYIGFGSNGCDFSSDGWLMAYNAATLQQVAIINMNPNESYGASIWQSGDGIAADSLGATTNTNNIYFSTANGALNWPTGDCGECVVKFSSLLGPEDYFSPANRSYLDTNDLDLGSGGVLLLPNQSTGIPRLLLAAGKQGTVYLINRDNLGQNAGTDQVVQELPGALPTVDGGGTGPAYWNGNIYYGTHKGMRMFALKNGMLSPVTASPAAINASAQGLLSVSANGNINGIAWVVRGSVPAPVLAAYNATNFLQLYNSTQAPNGRDTLSPIAHFTTPTIAAGRVYVGTQSQLVAYGLLPTLNFSSGNNQSAPAGSTLPQALQVKAVNPYTGAVISGVTVTFSDGGVGGTFGNLTVVTNSNGVAGTTYTLPSTAQIVTITASAPQSGGVLFKETAQ